MATFKHISSKNADYGAAEQYLTFEHDEFTMKPTLDENGRLLPRDDYRISSLNCGGEDFAIACMRSNLKYGKNQKREDVKSHHYIISFDPRDAQDNGLTVDRAQELGEQFCKEHFPGHQALVCTHPDGHNHSGNIHVHIVINSLRIEEVPLLPYMERPADTREGCKHRCTDAAMEYFKAEVMEMCHRENLYQIDLLNGSKMLVTSKGITWSFHKVLPLNIQGTNTVDYNMYMNISGRIVTIRMCADKCLMSGEILAGKFHPQSLRMFRSEPIIVTISGIKTDDIVMRLYFSSGLILMKVFIDGFTFTSKGIWITIDPFQKEFFPGNAIAVIV